MKLKFKTLLAIMFAIMVSKAQVTCQLNPTSNFALTLDQASTYVIYSKKPYYAKAIIEIMDQNSKLVKMETQPFSLTEGSATYNFANMMKDISYLNQDFKTYYQAIGNFFPGQYEICIDLLCPNPPNCENSVNEEMQLHFCFDAEVIEPIPLILTNPSDGEKLDHSLPFFQWLPPMPISQRIPIEYKMTLCEMNSNQSPEDAIYRNRPIFVSQMLEIPNHQYSSTYHQLEKGKHYAWRVDAYSKGKFLTQSEVWEFEVKADPIVYKSAIELKVEPGAVIHLPLNGIISFAFYQRNQSEAEVPLEYQLYNSKSELISNHKNIDIGVSKQGYNMVSIDVCSKWELNKGTYFLKIHRINGEICTFPFEIKENCNQN